MDIDVERAASLSHYYGIPFYTANAQELLHQNHLRLIYIASNHASHTEYAIQALEQGKDVYIEKPHVVSWVQLERLIEAMDRSGGRVYLGFNRPSSRIGRSIFKAFHSEDGAGVYNWFVAGHYLAPDHWYNRPEEGGRIFGNLCHWSDFLYNLVGPKGLPAEIVPIASSTNDVDISVAYTFQDRSIGVITFSAKSEPFEGIMERFSGQKGDCLVTMDDFWHLTVQIGAKKRRYRTLFRDHGHQDNIVGAYEISSKELSYDRDKSRTRIANTAVLYLTTREAIQNKRSLIAYPFDKSYLRVVEASHQSV